MNKIGAPQSKWQSFQILPSKFSLPNFMDFSDLKDFRQKMDSSSYHICSETSKKKQKSVHPGKIDEVDSEAATLVHRIRLDDRIEGIPVKHLFKLRGELLCPPFSVSLSVCQKMLRSFKHRNFNVMEETKFVSIYEQTPKQLSNLSLTPKEAWLTQKSPNDSKIRSKSEDIIEGNVEYMNLQ